MRPRDGGCHAGVHAARARLAARGGDDASVLGRARDDDGHLGEAGVEKALDGHEEAVEIDVQDRAVSRRALGDFCWSEVIANEKGGVHGGPPARIGLLRGRPLPARSDAFSASSR
jgi:hypothetical protein